MGCHLSINYLPAYKLTFVNLLLYRMILLGISKLFYEMLVLSFEPSSFFDYCCARKKHEVYFSAGFVSGPQLAEVLANYLYGSPDDFSAFL